MTPPDMMIVVEDLQPLMFVLRNAYSKAWSAWLENPLAARMEHKRVRANVVWSFVISYLRELLPQTGMNAEVIKACYTKGIFIKIDESSGCYFIRCKKANPDFFSANYPTQNALDFVDPQIDMFGGVTRLELVYVLDKLEINIETIALVCRVNETILWSYTLSAEIERINAYQAPISTTDTSQDSVKKRAQQIVASKMPSKETEIEAERVYANGHTRISGADSPRDD